MKDVTDNLYENTGKVTMRTFVQSDGISMIFSTLNYIYSV